MQACRTGDSGLAESGLSPGSTIVACNEQDITRKGSKKSRHQLLMILPHQLAFRKGYDCDLGELQSANTNTPSFVVKTAKHVLTYPGRFVSTTTSFFTIDLLPKAQQSVMSEMYQQLLIFDEPVLTEFKEDMVPSQAGDGASLVFGADAAEVAWTQLCGISSAADPHIASSSRFRREHASSPTPSAATSEGKDNAEEGSQLSESRPSRKATRNSSRYVELDNDFDGDEQSYASSEQTVDEPAQKKQKVSRAKAKNVYEDSEEEDEESSISSEESDEYVESSSRKRK